MALIPLCPAAKIPTTLAATSYAATFVVTQAMNRTAVQIELGVTPDGIWGAGTYRALFARMAAIAGAKPDVGVTVSLGVAATVHFPKYGIDQSAARLADFLAQTANETGGFTRFDENLNYSVQGMLRTWPKHFTTELANWAVGHPDRVAEVAYGNKSKTGKGRMGNVIDGWGYLYRGRGMLQLTGRDGYVATDKRLGIGLDTNPEIAAVPALSLLIACDFYRENGVLDALDAGDTAKARRITNGGSIGLDHVNALRSKIMEVLA
jgi:putative chitinase